MPLTSFDGQCVRAQWNRKHKEFVKFGSKTVLLGEDHPTMGKAIGLMKAKYEKDLTDIFLKQRFEEVTCFFEFYGPNSFAGQHDPKEEQTVTLIDAHVYKQGFMFPNEFTKLFLNVETPHIVHVGNFTKEIEEQVREGTLEGMSFEGLVCKTIKPLKNGRAPQMFKVKNKHWIQKVKDFCKGNLELEKQLL